jgi:hypothetical protein
LAIGGKFPFATVISMVSAGLARLPSLTVSAKVYTPGTSALKVGVAVVALDKTGVLPDGWVTIRQL